MVDLLADAFDLICEDPRAMVTISFSLCVPQGENFAVYDFTKTFEGNLGTLMNLVRDEDVGIEWKGKDVVKKVNPHKRAAKLGVKAGAVLIAINHHALSSKEDARDLRLPFTLTMQQEEADEADKANDADDAGGGKKVVTKSLVLRDFVFAEDKPSFFAPFPRTMSSSQERFARKRSMHSERDLAGTA
jgi:hypothetical protein